VAETRGEIAAVFAYSKDITGTGFLANAKQVNNATAANNCNSAVPIISNSNIATTKYYLNTLGYDYAMMHGASNVYSIATIYDFSVDVANNIGSVVGRSDQAIIGTLALGYSMSHSLMKAKGYNVGIPVSTSRNYTFAKNFSVSMNYQFKGVSVPVVLNLPLANVQQVQTQQTTFTKVSAFSAEIPWLDRGIDSTIGRNNITVVRDSFSKVETVAGSWFGSGMPSIGMARELNTTGKFTIVSGDMSSFYEMMTAKNGNHLASNGILYGDAYNKVSVTGMDTYNNTLQNFRAATAIENFTTYKFSDFSWGGVMENELTLSNGNTFTISLKEFGQEALTPTGARKAAAGEPLTANDYAFTSSSIPGPSIVVSPKVGNDYAGNITTVEVPLNQYSYGSDGNLYLPQRNLYGNFSKDTSGNTIYAEAVGSETIDFSGSQAAEAINARLPRFRAFTTDSTGKNISDERFDLGIYGSVNSSGLHEVYMLGSSDGVNFQPLNGKNFVEELKKATGYTSIGYTDNGATFGSSLASSGTSSGIIGTEQELTEMAQSMWASFDGNQNFPAKAFQMFGSLYGARSQDAFVALYKGAFVKKDDSYTMKDGASPFIGLTSTLSTDNHNWTVYKIAKDGYSFYEDHSHLDDSSGSVEIKDDMPESIQNLYGYTSSYGALAAQYAGVVRGDKDKMDKGLVYYNDVIDFAVNQVTISNKLSSDEHWVSNVTTGGEVVWVPVGYLAITYNGETRYIEASDYSEMIKAYAGQGLFNLASNDLEVTVNTPDGTATVYIDQKNWDKLSIDEPAVSTGDSSDDQREIDSSIHSTAAFENGKVYSKRGQGLFNYADNDILVIKSDGTAGWVNGKEVLNFLDFCANVTQVATNTLEYVASYSKFGGGFSQTLSLSKSVSGITDENVLRSSVLKTIGSLGFSLTPAQLQESGLTNYKTIQEMAEGLGQKYNYIYSTGSLVDSLNKLTTALVVIDIVSAVITVVVAALTIVGTLGTTTAPAVVGMEAGTQAIKTGIVQGAVKPIAAAAVKQGFKILAEQGLKSITGKIVAQAAIKLAITGVVTATLSNGVNLVINHEFLSPANTLRSFSAGIALSGVSMIPGVGTFLSNLGGVKTNVVTRFLFNPANIGQKVGQTITWGVLAAGGANLGSLLINQETLSLDQTLSIFAITAGSVGLNHLVNFGLSAWSSKVISGVEAGATATGLQNFQTITINALRSGANTGTLFGNIEMLLGNVGTGYNTEDVFLSSLGEFGSGYWKGFAIGAAGKLISSSGLTKITKWNSWSVNHPIIAQAARGALVGGPTNILRGWANSKFTGTDYTLSQAGIDLASGLAIGGILGLANGSLMNVQALQAIKPVNLALRFFNSKIALSMATSLAGGYFTPLLLTEKDALGEIGITGVVLPISSKEYRPTTKQNLVNLGIGAIAGTAYTLIPKYVAWSGATLAKSHSVLYTSGRWGLNLLVSQGLTFTGYMSAGVISDLAEGRRDTTLAELWNGAGDYLANKIFAKNGDFSKGEFANYFKLFFPWANPDTDSWANTINVGSWSLGSATLAFGYGSFIGLNIVTSPTFLKAEVASKPADLLGKVKGAWGKITEKTLSQNLHGILKSMGGMFIFSESLDLAGRAYYAWGDNKLPNKFYDNALDKTIGRFGKESFIESIRQSVLSAALFGPAFYFASPVFAELIPNLPLGIGKAVQTIQGFDFGLSAAQGKFFSLPLSQKTVTAVSWISDRLVKTLMIGTLSGIIDETISEEIVGALLYAALTPILGKGPSSLSSSTISFIASMGAEVLSPSPGESIDVDVALDTILNGLFAKKEAAILAGNIDLAKEVHLNILGIQSEVAYNNGILAFNKGDFAAAELGFQEAIDKVNESNSVLEFSDGKIVPAQAFKANYKSSLSATLHYNLGVSQFRQSNLEQAAYSFYWASRISPDVKSYNALGDMNLARMNFSGAREAFNEAIEISPKDPGSYYGLGLADVGLGEWVEAISNFETAYKLNPSEDNLKA
jgi:tetratricopeptide (TPR) repeat protein